MRDLEKECVLPGRRKRAVRKLNGRTERKRRVERSRALHPIPVSAVRGRV